jgi:hypothetical protein
MDREEQRLLAEADRYADFRPDREGAYYKAKSFFDAMGAVVDYYERHQRWSDAAAAVRRQLDAIDAMGAREEVLPDTLLHLAALQVAMVDANAARRTLRRANKALDVAKGLPDRRGFEKRRRAIEKELSTLKDAAPSPAERWAHPTYGEGVLESRSDDVLQLRFPDGISRKFQIRFLVRVL